VVVCLVWGTTPFAIKTGLLAGWQPLWFCALRLLAACAIVSPLLLTRFVGEPLGLAGWRTVLPMGVFGIALNFGLMVWGQQYIGAALASLIVGSQPITTTVIDHLVRRRPPTRRFVLSLVAGTAGMLVIFRAAGVPGSRELLGASAVLGGVTIYAGIFVYIRARVGALNVVRVTVTQNLIGGSLVAVAAVLLEGGLRLPSGPQAWVSFGYLFTFSSIAALILAVWLIGQMGPARFSIVSFITPMVGVMASVLFLGESLDLLTVGGAGLIAVALVLALRPGAPAGSPLAGLPDPAGTSSLAGGPQIVLDSRGSLVQPGEEPLPELCDRDT
jgi:drug/metabolite transporter (DMT)-like permease